MRNLGDEVDMEETVNKIRKKKQYAREKERVRERWKALNSESETHRTWQAKKKKKI